MEAKDEFSWPGDSAETEETSLGSSFSCEAQKEQPVNKPAAALPEKKHQPYIANPFQTAYGKLEKKQ